MRAECTHFGSLHHDRMSVFLEKVTVYPVSCEKLASGRSDQEWLEAVLAGGAKIVQLRDKDADDRTLFQKALFFRRLTREAGALFLVNDRVDIALMADADGVHLGNSDLPAEEVRRLAPDMVIGVSANTVEQAATTEQRGASYYNIGPVFPTETKEGLSSFLGVEAIREFSARSSLPFSVMGGIKLDHVPALVDAGARRIAVVTAITRAKDMEVETRRWVDRITARIAVTTPTSAKNNPV